MIQAHKSPSKDSTSPEVLQSRAQRITRFLLWSLVTVFFLLFFTLLKLPEDKLRNWIDGNIAVALAQRGISFSATNKSLSFLFGPTYVLQDATFNFPPPTPPTHLDELSVSPAIFPMVLGRYGGNGVIRNKEGKLSFSAAVRDFNKGLKGDFSFRSKKMDLGKTGILSGFTGLQISSANLDGDGALKGDFMVPNTLEGNIAVRLTPLIFDAQSIQGFSVPKLTISDGLVEFSAEKGKLLIKNFKLGKPGATGDDIQCNVSGEITLNRNWESSTLNLKINFSISENVKKSFILLDTLLTDFKQADGSYSLLLTGSVFAPIPAPAGGRS